MGVLGGGNVQYNSSKEQRRGAEEEDLSHEEGGWERWVSRAMKTVLN